MNPNDRINALLQRANTLSNRIAALTTRPSAVEEPPVPAVIEENPVSASFSPSDSKPRCFICNRKLNLVEQSAGWCKCKTLFCSKHRCVRNNTTDVNRCHPCSFDYLKEQKELVSAQNPVIKIDKLNFH